MAVISQRPVSSVAYGPASAKDRLDKDAAASYQKSTVRPVNRLETGQHFSYILCKR